MKTFSLKVLASDRVFFDDRCAMVILPAKDGQLGVLVEQVNLGVLDGNLDALVTGVSGGGGLHAGGELEALDVDVQEGLGTHHLGNLDVGLNLTVGELLQQTGLVVDVLGTDTHDNFLTTNILIVNYSLRLVGRKKNICAGSNNIFYARNVKLALSFYTKLKFKKRVAVSFHVPVIVLIESNSAPIAYVLGLRIFDIEIEPA